MERATINLSSLPEPLTKNYLFMVALATTKCRVELTSVIHTMIKEKEMTFSMEETILIVQQMKMLSLVPVMTFTSVEVVDCNMIFTVSLAMTRFLDLAMLKT